MPVLEFKNVSKVYNKMTTALADVSFAVNEGEIVSIIGPSGAGKSTVLRCINRLVNASSGEITFDGHNVINAGKKEIRQIRKKIGMVFQHYNLVYRLSVVENVLHGRLGSKLSVVGAMGHYTEKEKELAFQILEKLNLTDQAYKRCDELSGGQKQRVGIGRAIMQAPRLLLCDEPIASLDPSSAKIIMDHLHDISRTMNYTCILNLHQVDVALRYSDRIIGLAEGRVIYDGPPDKLDRGTIHKIYQSDEGELITDVS